MVSPEMAAELTAPLILSVLDEVDAVFQQLVDEVVTATTSFGQRTQAVLGRSMSLNEMLQH